jgi:hypothetical protein
MGTMDKSAMRRLEVPYTLNTWQEGRKRELAASWNDTHLELRVHDTLFVPRQHGTGTGGIWRVNKVSDMVGQA